jgi:hypothetical protein
MCWSWYTWHGFWVIGGYNSKTWAILRSWNPEAQLQDLKSETLKDQSQSGHGAGILYPIVLSTCFLLCILFLLMLYLLYKTEGLLRAELVCDSPCILITWEFKVGIYWMAKWLHNLRSVGWHLPLTDKCSPWWEEREFEWMDFVKQGAWTRSAVLSWNTFRE